VATLVETGTALGDTIQAVKGDFQQIYSIELSETLYQRAVKRFARFDHIHLLQGDSGVLLPEVARQLNAPALFWLDAHYSAGPTAKGDKDSPILNEMSAVLMLGAPDHVILIDDAREFTGTHDYPTLEELRQHVERLRPGLEFHVEYDIIRIHGKMPPDAR
jgi:hypothetical protein